MEIVQRTLLLVDDENNIVASLKRLFHREGYRILHAYSAEEALEVLAQHEVGVILSDHRMPGMTGVEFLHVVKERYPDTVRIILSGFSDIALVIDAINRGAVYKFLAKPWEDELLRENISEAFLRYEMKQENERLAAELQQANVELGRRVKLSASEAARNLRLHEVSQRVLESLPVAVVGMDDTGMIVAANRLATQILLRYGLPAPVVGEMAMDCLPPVLLENGARASIILPTPRGQVCLQCWHSRMDCASDRCGRLLVFVEDEDKGRCHDPA